ncbi:MULTISPECIES: class I SAM-dependent methyltransferase [Mammaliicoccus]|jgi:site-specific DNA-methyltransferase (adenine-specific)|uniref:Class I SAM-dependent methyltransferase n=1 Tax=Mammaliicoccus sciuri TaxID=1296 RepID=A0AAW5LFQ6_MAMSC|nr:MULTISPECIES: class I SAM-dependent methyltransferase [Mammaliicoccus]KTT81003.1 adenine methyltransferase [Mammaliicoccus sciuri]MBA1396774.1 N-6 DNA methylase [Mammaliicoccus sciuri]MBF0719166.1 class I SAM-dependent methyltransferase [Mammaliicoccus sciuri]MBF0774275.1 class I SAM-dependent methyltransferase [Mammaliicoccus sciuri]MBG9204890.1 class I SAM-dependent methyltransferase [Mammaliicoccus sciuri]
MTEEKNMMEVLFEKLDVKSKDLHDENGQSYIENLGLAMEDIYTNQRDLLEQSTLQERRKAFQFAYLSLLKEEVIQPNHQMTPDSIGFILSYLVNLFNKNKKELNIVDIASGTGHLSATINEQNQDKTLMHHLIEVDPVLQRVSIHLANFLEIPFDVYPQDAIMPLPLEEADVIVGDLPVGYYPLDERSKEMKLGFDEGHSYSHYLLLEQAVTATRPGGYVFLIVPTNIFEGEEVKQLQKYIATETEMQAFLNFPNSLFKTEQSRKSLLILQKKDPGNTKSVEVLLANIPDFKAQSQLQTFLSEVDEWMKENHSL